MGILSNKKLLITGVISNRSIAYATAKACVREGASIILTYATENIKERVTALGAELGATAVLPLNVQNDEEITSVVESVRDTWGTIDGLLHAIAFAPREAIAGDFIDGISREAFHTAMDISSYSLPSLAKAFAPIMNPGASIVTLTYLGGERYVANYNTMGLCKAALDASVRYLAMSLGSKSIRINAISAGPVRTLASAGIKGFTSSLDYMKKNTPLRRNITADEVGNAAAFLFSDLASGITGSTVYVDAGFHSTATGPEL